MNSPEDSGGGKPAAQGHFSKRLFDMAVALPLLVLLSPIIAAVALAVRLKLGSPIFFRQERPGLGGKPFKLIKFRTMADSRNQRGELLSDAERLTAFGKWLRSTSLDELPELWNVLKGEMSLVGPRPLLLQYVPLYTPFEMRRHLVRPGITGWVAVNGRNALSWPEKFALDVWYVDNRTLLLDLKILLLTVVRVMTRRGITAEGEATMPQFESRSSPEGRDPTQDSGARLETEAEDFSESPSPRKRRSSTK